MTCAALSGSELAALRNPAEGLCFGVDRPSSELRQSEVARPPPLTFSELEPSPRTLEPEASYILGCLGHMTHMDPKLRGDERRFVAKLAFPAQVTANAPDRKGDWPGPSQ